MEERTRWGASWKTAGDGSGGGDGGGFIIGVDDSDKPQNRKIFLFSCIGKKTSRSSTSVDATVMDRPATQNTDPRRNILYVLVSGFVLFSNVKLYSKFRKNYVIKK